MLEIGSEFWEVPITDQKNIIFSESTQWYLSGRSALQAIIADLGKARSVTMPSWCCDSMIKPFIDAGLEVYFYPVYWHDGLVQEICFDSDVLFLMDYFGYTSQKPDLSSYDGIVIRDVTHSIFSKSYDDADYYFGSLRKWCGIWTGGYAWTKDGHLLNFGSNDDSEYVSLRKKAMLQKAEYIKGDNKDKGYLKVFDKAEECLETVGIAPSMNRDVEMAKHLDVDLIKQSRRSNATVLRNGFPDWLVFPEMKPKDSPLSVPILVPNRKRDELRRYLINKSIYCPVHWQISRFHKLNEQTAYLYENELSLVCDQRYSNDEMNRIVDVINQFMEDM